MLNKGTERERGSMSKMILVVIFCSLKLMFRFSLDVDVQMLAPYKRDILMIALWYVLPWSLVKYGLIFFNRSILFGTLLARALRSLQNQTKAIFMECFNGKFLDPLSLLGLPITSRPLHPST